MMSSIAIVPSFCRLQSPFIWTDRPRVPPSLLKFVSPSSSSKTRVDGVVQCAVHFSTTAPITELVEPRSEKVELACPVCYQPLISSGRQGLNLVTARESSFRCNNCNKSFGSDGGIINLTIFNDSPTFGTSFFQNPLVAFVYERGYRDTFPIFSFPGVDEEARRARELLEPARDGVILDLSCGPGTFTRRFLASGDYKMVIALDFSQAMLEQCSGFLESDAPSGLSNVLLVRGDVGRLPLATSSLAGVHAGAAVHCWPDVANAIAEISRVLRPGGVLVASTFLLPTPAALEESLKPIRKRLNQLQLTLAWFTEAELRATAEACGLVNWYSYRQGMYILFSATKATQ